MMQGKNSTGLLIVALGVLMLLLRPFAVYQISLKNHLSPNPGRAHTMLQRMVKKKDEHHASDAGAVVMENSGRLAIRIVRPALLFIAAFFIAMSKAFNVKLPRPDALALTVSRYRYRLLSCLLI